MGEIDHGWALVLAAGEGQRLRALTTNPAGVPVPKQFCTLEHGPSLLQQAMLRAESVAARERICTIVAGQHRQWWVEQLETLPAANIIVQPRNCGTANGILLSLLRIVERDPGARITVLPADHYVRDEDQLVHSLRLAAGADHAAESEILLLGLTPRTADVELGYIVPGAERRGSGHREVERFVEKPPVSAARALIGQGALWNSFIMTAEARALLSLFGRRHPGIVVAMRAALDRDAEGSGGGGALAEFYEHLPPLDFSRDILEGQERHLRVLPVPECGWSDLGTPQRVGEVLQGGPSRHSAGGRHVGARDFLSLAAQYRQLAAVRASA